MSHVPRHRVALAAVIKEPTWCCGRTGASSGAPIGNPASRRGAPVTTVTIAPKKGTSATVGFLQTGNFPPAKCKPVTAKGLRIIPPNQTKSVILKRSFPACSSKSVNFLTVAPVT